MADLGDLNSGLRYSPDIDRNRFTMKSHCVPSNYEFLQFKVWKGYSSLPDRCSASGEEPGFGCGLGGLKLNLWMIVDINLSPSTSVILGHLK